MSAASMEANAGMIFNEPSIELPWISYIEYPTSFDQYSIKVLINFGYKVNVIQPSFASNV